MCDSAPDIRDEFILRLEHFTRLSPELYRATGADKFLPYLISLQGGKAMTSDTSAMTKGEREALAGLARKRERLSKTAASQRSAELLADFEQQLGTAYSFDDDETWAALHAAAKEAVDTAGVEIAKRCKELGIPKNLAPGLDLRWYRRGENGSKERRTELRKMAVTRIAAMEKAARTAIESNSVEVQTELLAGGLTTDAAKIFLEEMPTAETLMPVLDATEIKGLLGDNSRGGSQS